MQLKHLSSLILPALLLTGTANANVTEEDFVAKTTQNLVNLCSASPEDPHYLQAIHFCEGYLVGAYHFYAAQAANEPFMQTVCYPNPKPTRNTSVRMFVAWAKKHPQFMNELPVETEFRFLHETWPCKK